MSEEVCEAVSYRWKHPLQEGPRQTQKINKRLPRLKRHKLGRFWKTPSARSSFIKGGKSYRSKRRLTIWAEQRDLNHSRCLQAVQSALGSLLSWGPPCGFVVMSFCHLWSCNSSPTLPLVTPVKTHWFTKVDITAVVTSIYYEFHFLGEWTPVLCLTQQGGDFF